jgi:hypothetical protein
MLEVDPNPGTRVSTPVQKEHVPQADQEGSKYSMLEVDSQSTELTRGPPELVQHFRLCREFTSAQKRSMIVHCCQIWYGLAVSLACPSREDGGPRSNEFYLPSIA